MGCSSRIIEQKISRVSCPLLWIDLSAHDSVYYPSKPERKKNMNKKQQKKLEAIMRKYENAQDDDSAMLSQTAFAISVDKGVWTKDGKPFKLSWYSLEGNRRSSSNVIFYYDSVEDGLLGIKRLKNGKLFAFNDSDFQCEITDADLIAVIEELAPKAKGKKAKKPLTQKKKKSPVAVKPSTRRTSKAKSVKPPKSSVKFNQGKEEKAGETANKKPVTYMDVFDRVLDIMDDKTGYAPYDGNIKDEENGEVDIGLDFDGFKHRTWKNVKAFVGGDPDEESIFEVVADLDAVYHKLASRWDAQFCDSCRILGNVEVEDTSPAGIMKALDEAGL